VASNANIRDKRSAPPPTSNRVLIFTTDEALSAWIEAELDGLDLTRQLARSVRDAVAALIEDPPPRPQIMVADFDSMSAADVLHLHAIRDGGWFGSMIAIGSVGADLRSSLNIDHVLERPLTTEMLRNSVKQIGLDRATTKMPTLPTRR
jgi:hypothetical protein